MIVVFGSVNLDLTATTSRIPRPGETVAGTAFATAPGGKGANQALAACRAGAAVAMVGAVGSDDFARTALANLESSGVNLEQMEAVSASTGVALINVADDGQNAITVVAGANALVRATQVPDDWLNAETIVLMQLEVPIGEVDALAQRARRQGSRVILNAAPAAPLPESLWRSLDALIVNESEADLLAHAAELPMQPGEFARAAFARYGCTTVVTLGAAGAIAADAQGLVDIDAPQVHVLDTTGAGDAFCGAFACAWQRRMPLPKVLELAVIAGAKACTQRGAQVVDPAPSAR